VIVVSGRESLSPKPVDNAGLLAVIGKALGEPARPEKPAVYGLGSG
jgi:hypothetical protein